jgi:hypothetical protein
VPEGEVADHVAEVGGIGLARAELGHVDLESTPGGVGLERGEGVFDREVMGSAEFEELFGC